LVVGGERRAHPRQQHVGALCCGPRERFGGHAHDDIDADRRKASADDAPPLRAVRVAADVEHCSTAAAARERARSLEVRAFERVQMRLAVAGHAGREVVIGGRPAVGAGYGAPVEREVDRPP